MREEDNAAAEGSGDAPAGATGRRPGIAGIAVLLVSLLAGGASGVLLVGPRLSAAPAEKAHEEESSHGGGHGKQASNSHVHTIESLVLNPSGSAGTRFLIASVVVELDGAKSAELLKSRDAAARDALLHVLSARTVDELADIDRRDSLRVELARALEGVMGTGQVRRVFLPQFVLQ